MAAARWLLAACAAVVLGGSIAAGVRVVALGVTDDPIRVLNGRIDDSEPTPRPVLVVDLQNAITVPVSTAQVFLAISSYYTTTDSSGGKPVTDIAQCTTTLRAEAEERARIIAPGKSVSIRIPAAPACMQDRPDENFFVYVAQVAVPALYGGAQWTRDARDVPRLLAAALAQQ